jgi:hypothetical protein
MSLDFIKKLIAVGIAFTFDFILYIIKCILTVYIGLNLLHYFFDIKP